MIWRRYDKLVYSVAWLSVLLFTLSMVIKQDGPFWDVVFGFVIVSIIIQLGLVLYNISDFFVRRQMWKKLKGKVEVISGTGERGEI